MNHRDNLGADQENTNFSFLDSRKISHIYKLTVVADQILFTKVQKGFQIMIFHIIIKNLGAFDLRVTRQGLPSTKRSIVDHLHAPDSFTTRATILLEHTITEGKRSGKFVVQLVCVVVSKCIRWHQSSLSFYKGGS